MSPFPSWPGRLARRHVYRLVETLETLVVRLRESLARTVGEFVAIAFHELSCMLAGSAPPERSSSQWEEDRPYSEWEDGPDYDDRYREVDAESARPHESTASRWRRSLSLGLQAAGWWLARQVGRYPVVTSTGLGLTAALVSYGAGPVVGVGLAGIAGALLHLAGLAEAVETGAGAISR